MNQLTPSHRMLWRCAHVDAQKQPLQAVHEAFNITQSSAALAVTDAFTQCYRDKGGSCNTTLQDDVQSFLEFGTVPAYVLACAADSVVGEFQLQSD